MRRLRPYLDLAAAGLFWGLGLPLGKVALAEMDAAHLMMLRFAVAALGALPILAAKRAFGLLLRPVVVGAGALYAAAYLVQFEGLERASVSLSALLIGVSPVLYAVTSAALGQKVGRAAWGGVVAAASGAALIAGRPDRASSPLGLALVLASLLIFLCWQLAIRDTQRRVGALEASAAVIVVAAVALALAVPLTEGPPRLALSGGVWAALVGQGLLSTLLATSAWQAGAPRVTLAAAGVFINIEPLVGALIGVLGFHDRPTAASVGGAALILGGSLLVVLAEARAPGGASPAEDAPTPA